MGGNVPAYPGTIEYITIPTQGNATDFGNQTDYRGTGAAVSSKILSSLLSPIVTVLKP